MQNPSLVTDNMSVIADRLASATIQTRSGILVSPLKFKREFVRVSDIIHSLCNKVRFTGHPREFYSVGQHSTLVSLVAGQLALAEGMSDEEVLLHERWGEVHDGDEAYLPDIPSPLKVLPEFAFLKEAGLRIRNDIMDVLGLPREEPPLVKKADRILLVTEKRDLMVDLGIDTFGTYGVRPMITHINPLPPSKAKKQMIERYIQLFGNIPS